ncbi:MAG: pyruvate:ferredoxin (flavodoxin) oxidoreductase [Kiritimatiellia bacterium]
MAKYIMVDGNEATARVAFACSEVAAIYPITPSSPMAEFADEWASRKQMNIWGTIPQIVELQSEAGAAGAVHGALTTGSLTTTFTASQGLLLMIPNMYKIAGELTPAVFHVSARALAMQGLSIFGDHGDIMACRQTGFAFLGADSVQECGDMALISHASTLQSKIPFIHFFDGFRTSHEVQKIEEIPQDVIREMIDEKEVDAFRARGLNPEAPQMRGTAQNPDVYFQGRETVNKYYEKVPGIVQANMDKLAKLTGRQYHLFDFVGAPDAEDVVVVMGSGCETVQEVVEERLAEGAKIGVIKVRLYRPFDVKAFAAALPKSLKRLTVLDRSKEPGAVGEPLYTDVRTAIGDAMQDGVLSIAYPKTYGGRYGLGSKEFTPAMVEAVFENMKAASPKNHFTVGINDDVSGSSITVPSFLLKDSGATECMFYGLGSDGTVGANKNSIKLIGNATENFAQGYFVYDSKKAGGLTVSHLRFGPNPIHSPYLCTKVDFVACHNFSFLEKYDMLSSAKVGATFLLQSEYDEATVWNHIPDEVAKVIIDKKLKFYVVNAMKVAQALGLGGRTNTIMQTAFFCISGIIKPVDKAVDLLKQYAKKAYAKKGDDVVQLNWKAIDEAQAAIKEVKIPAAPAGKKVCPATVSADAPQFVKDVTAKMMSQNGDTLPVSAIPEDGTWPTATTQYEKRNIAVSIPSWNNDTCIQCLKCSTVCPHAAIRAKVYGEECLKDAPATFKSCDGKPPFKGKKFTLQVAIEDCTGCGLCSKVCPELPKTGKTLTMIRYDQDQLRKPEVANWNFFLNLPEADLTGVPLTAKTSQLKRPLFEFSGACAGCGETPYVKMLTQICGDHLCIANATGCSSIYGGNLPTTPYCQTAEGKGPAWSNSLFEDNAEFGLGMVITRDKQQSFAKELAEKIIASGKAPAEFSALLGETVAAMLTQKTDEDIKAQRARVAQLKAFIATCECATCKKLATVADFFVRRSVWILGGDGWAYDIGYGGLDHVLASGRNVKILVLDTEVYSNTGGQASKATPIGAVAKFAAAGKPQMKKDLAAISMTYKNIYVAQISMGVNPEAAVKAFKEAEEYEGPALIIAYSHCIAHGINLSKGLEHQKMAVESGHFPLFRYSPESAKAGKNPLTLDSKAPSVKFSEVQALNENRFKQLAKLNPEEAKVMFAEADAFYSRKYDYLQALAALNTY